MQQKFRDLLHQYKVEVFRNEHDAKSAEELSAECMHQTEEILEEKFQYHFHRLPDANRAEIINMINNYVREAVLPPVVEKLVKKQVVLEKRIDALVHLVENSFDALSSEATAS